MTVPASPQMTAMQMLPQPLTQREFADTLRDLRDATEPIIREAARIMSTATPSYLRHEDGTMEVKGDGLDEPQRESLRQLDVLREQIAAPYIAKLNRGLREE